MKKTKSLLNDIVKIYKNNPKVKKAADELLEAVKKPKTFKAMYTKDLPFEINYIDYLFPEIKSFLELTEIIYMYSNRKGDDDYDKDITKEISMLHKYMKKNNIDLLVHKDNALGIRWVELP